MTNRFYIQCPSCGHIYQLKIQVDRNIFLFDWPIVIECSECGDVIRCVYGSKGLSMKTLPYEQLSDHGVVTTMVGYSSSLPIVDEIYMKDGDGLDAMVLFSPFLNLTRGHFSLEELRGFDVFVSHLQQRVLPHKGALLALLPIVKKGNIQAYCKKYADLYHEKIELDTMNLVYKHYMELVGNLYRDMRSAHYSQHEFKQYIEPLFEFINQSDVKELKKVLNGAGTMSEWYKNKALPYIARVLNQVEKLIPCMIFSVVGEYGIYNRGMLYMSTIAHRDAANFYKDGYEVFVKGLPYLVGVRNMMTNGCADLFSNAGMKGVDTLAAFAKLPGGLMEDKLSDDQYVVGWIGNTMNHKVRNAATHDELEYDSKTQILKCHYNSLDRKEVYSLSLIELCDMVYMQWLHIMELTLMAFTIVTRSKAEE